MEKRELSKENPFRSNLLFIISEKKHQEIFGKSSLSPSYGGESAYVGSTDSYRRAGLAIAKELLKFGIVTTTKPLIAVCSFQAPDILVQALQSISAPSQFVVSSVNLKNEIKGSTIAASYRGDDLALNGAYTHYMSGAHQLLIFSDCLEEVANKWGYLLIEAARMYDELIIINPDCLRTRKVFLTDLRQARMVNEQDVRQEWSISLVSDFVVPSEKEILAKLNSIQEAHAWQKLQEEKRQAEERVEKKAKAKKKLASLIKGAEISERTENCLLEMLISEKELWGASILDSETVALVSGRNEWGSSGGVGYYSQAVMIFQDHSEIKEWCYRDRYDSYKDDWSLCIEKIGQIKSEQKGERISFRIELLNKNKSRWTEFSFAFKPEEVTALTLSIEDRSVFKEQVDETIANLLAIKEERWIGQPEMIRYSEISQQLLPGESIYVKYQKPTLQQKVLREGNGIAVFVLVEQIDHRVSDPQLRYELYSLKHGQSQATLLIEDHSYDRSEGNAMISVIDLNSSMVKLKTRKGEQIIRL